MSFQFSCPLFESWRSEFFVLDPIIELRSDVIMENWEVVMKAFCAAIDLIVNLETVRSDFPSCASF